MRRFWFWETKSLLLPQRWVKKGNQEAWEEEKKEKGRGEGGGWFWLLSVGWFKA